MGIVLAWIVGLVGAGIAVGYFFATGPLIIITVLAVALIIACFNAANSGPPGTSGGLGLLFIAGMVLIFLVPMWLTYLAVHIEWSLTWVQ